MQMSWGKTVGYKRGPVHLDFVGSLAPNRFLARFHNRQLMSCHYLLSRQQGEQAECTSWSAAVSAASRTGTKQASGNVLKKERGGKTEEEREEDGGAGSLSEGLAKDSRKRQVRKGTARTSEGNGPGGHTGRKWTRLHWSKRCHWNLGVIPTASVSARRNVSPTPSPAKAPALGAEDGGAGTGLCGLGPAH